VTDTYGTTGLAVPVITDDMSMPEVALAIAAAGMYVFPVDHPELPQCAGIGQGHNPKTCNERGKHPAVAFSTAADTNPKMIHMWWAGPPRNIGINCGKSNLVVIDEDKLGAFKKYADEHGHKITPTMVVATAKGRHYYFVAPAGIQLGNGAGALKDYNIDVRAGNAYVVAPGSTHATGVTYRIEVALPPAPLPDWVVQAIKAKTNGHKDDGGVWETVGDDFDRFELPDVIKDHTRDDTLFKYASSLLARELPRGEAEILMRAAWQRCEQPPKAESAYTVEEALAKLDRYEPGRSEGYEKADRDPDTERATFDTLVAKEAAKIRVREAAQRKVRTEQRRDLGNLEPIRLTEFLATPDEPTQYRIDSLWPTGGRIVLAAQFKAGKTTTVNNIVRSLADSDPFLGRFDTTPAQVALVDFEMDSRKVRQWLRDQQIRNTDNVHVVPLRGKVSAFDVLDPKIRSEWAARIRGNDVAIFDCLRPILDSLGLDENRDAGRLLTALDELLNEAQVPEGMLVHHMGHSGERSRGDSRIIDWPDATWKLVRENPELEGSPRYFSAYGRDVFRAESLLEYDPQTRRLTLRGGNRQDAANERLMPPLFERLAANPDGMSGRQIEDALVEAGHGRNEARKAREYAVKRLYLVTSPGAKNAIIHRINPDLPEPVRQCATSAPLVRRNTESVCASAPIGGAHTQHTGSDAVCDPTDDSQPTPVGSSESPPVDLTDSGSDAVKEVAPVARTDKRQKVGACAGCGERMTITQGGQTTHPGCEVTQ
jgi:hypothetical protein